MGSWSSYSTKLGRKWWAQQTQCSSRWNRKQVHSWPFLTHQDPNWGFLQDHWWQRASEACPSRFFSDRFRLRGRATSINYRERWLGQTDSLSAGPSASHEGSHVPICKTRWRCWCRDLACSFCCHCKVHWILHVFWGSQQLDHSNRCISLIRWPIKT